jgi:hypothetical protein
MVTFSLRLHYAETGSLPGALQDMRKLAVVHVAAIAGLKIASP